MTAKPFFVVLLIVAVLAPLAGRSDPAPPPAPDAKPAPAATVAPPPAAATPAKEAAGPQPKPSETAKSTPQHFEPTEKTRADFEVSFPIDI